MRLLTRIFHALSGFGFTCLILLFLLLLTWLGTLEQIEFGLYTTQKKYFESYVLVHDAGPWAVKFPWAEAAAEPLFTLGPIPIPLPGVNLLLTALMINLICGGIVRMRKDFRRAGVLVAHLGIAFMLLAGFVEHLGKHEGILHCPPGQPVRTYFSFHDWDVTIRDADATGRVKQFVIPGEEWRDLDGATARFNHDELPFDLRVTKSFRNARVVQQGPMFRGDGPIIDGYVVLDQPPLPENERNVPALYVTAIDQQSGRQVDQILWGFQDHAATLEAGGKKWLIDVGRRRYDLPFEVRLEKIIVEFHPGISLPRTFWSNITKIEETREQAMRVTMNEPVRHDGYVLFQTGWGPQTFPLRPDLYSEFTVVENPSDQWPKWACYLIGIGLLFHFSLRLKRYVANLRQQSA